MKKYHRLFEQVKVLYQMPTGWKEISGAQTSPSGYVWICNCKSIFSTEYQHALLRVKNKNQNFMNDNEKYLKAIAANTYAICYLLTILIVVLLLTSDIEIKLL